MKSLLTSATKVFKLSFVMLALASVPVFAGGNEKTEDKKTEAEVYAEALSDLEKSLNETEDLKNIYTPTPQIKFYDSDFNIVREADIPKDGFIEDEELLILIMQSDEFMKFENITYYILKD